MRAVVLIKGKLTGSEDTTGDDNNSNSDGDSNNDNVDDGKDGAGSDIESNGDVDGYRNDNNDDDGRRLESVNDYFKKKINMYLENFILPVSTR